MPPPDCPSADELAAFHRGDVPPAVGDRITAHLEGCPACEAVLEGLDARQEAVTQILRRGRDLPTPAPPATATTVAAGLPRAGDVVAGRYELVEEVGTGGMGCVWMARQTEPVKRTVALKLVKPGMDSARVLARFDAERQALARMDHPNIAQVYDAGSGADGRPFFVMELVRGVSLTAYCDAYQLTPRQRLALFVAVCLAVQHAHQKGVIHRDIKPNNILVAEYDGKPVPKVIDFGVAKAVGDPLTDQTIETGDGLIVGTPEYMAPEQAGDATADVDTRADVYALGGVLYELLTGSPPFSRAQLARAGLLEILRVVREQDPPRPSTRLSSADALPAIAARRGTPPARLTALVRGELDWVVMKALEKDRDRRYDSAGGLARDVERFLADEPVEAGRPSPGYRFRKLVRRHRRPIAAAAAFVLLLAVSAVVSTVLAVVAIQEGNEKKRALGELTLEQQHTQQALAQLTDQQRQTAAALGRVTAEEAKTKAALATARDELDSRRLVQAFFLDNIIAAGRPEGQGVGLGRDVTLRRAVDAAVPKIAAAFAGRPLVEATVRVGLAEAYFALGDPIQSGEQYGDAHRLRVDALGPHHRDTLTAARGVAITAGTIGDANEAVRQLKDIVAASRTHLGRDDRDTLRAEGDLATWHIAADEFAPAVELLEGLVPKFTAAHGPDHPDTLTAMANLAEAYARDAGRPDAAARLRQAVGLLEAVHRSRQAYLGAGHPRTLIVAGNLATTYSLAGDHDQAAAMLAQVAPARAAVLGPDHPDTLIALTALGMVHLNRKQPGQAVPPLEQAAAGYAGRPDPDHPDALNARTFLAKAYGQAGQGDKAVAVLEGVLKARLVRPGPDHPLTRATRLQLAREELARGRADKAKEHHAAFLAGCHAQYGADAPGYAAALERVAGDLLAARQYAAAEPHLAAAVALRAAKQPTAWTRYAAEAQLGAAQLGRGEHAAAATHLTAAFDGLERLHEAGPLPADATDALWSAADSLIRLHTATGQTAAADQWRTRRDQYAPGKPGS